MKLLCALPALLSLSLVCMGETAPEPLQRRADQARGAECAKLSMQVARQSLEDAHQLFNSGNSRAAHEKVEVAVRYAERAVDCTLESRKREKQIEIELRGFIRRTREVARTVETEERPQLHQSIEQLERARDRLLQAIFGPAGWSDKPAKSQ